MSIFGKPILTGVGKGSASGAVASFSDGAKGLPLRSLVVNIDPVQDLHGYDNPWPAGGNINKLDPTVSYSGLTYNPAVGRVFTPTVSAKKWTDNGDGTFSNTLGDWEQAGFVIGPLPNGAVYFSFASATGGLRISVFVMDSEYAVNRVSQNWNPITEGAAVAVNTTFSGTDTYLGVYIGGAAQAATISQPYVYTGADASIRTYYPYSNICPISGWSEVNVWLKPTYDPTANPTVTIQIGQTIYGGTLDVTNGVLTVDRYGIDLGVFTWTAHATLQHVYQTPRGSYPVWKRLSDGETANAICSRYVLTHSATGGVDAIDFSIALSTGNSKNIYVHDSICADATEFNTEIQGTILVYELAAPITIPLTPQEISTLQGVNNVWADSGDSTVEYLKKSLMQIGSTIRPPHYGCVWDQENAQMRRTGLARAITTNTQNFKHSGSVNPNYDNPFDSIYPWSERKLCNISLALYQALQPGDNIKDCVTYWETDDGFSYNDPDGVWVYTPEFWGTSYWIGSQRYFEVSPIELAGYHHYEEQITARWRGTSETRTIDGTNKTILLSKPGMPIVNTVLSTIHTYAKNGGMTLDSVYTLDASLLLYLVEYANYNAQSAIGNGVSDLYDQTTLHPDAAVTAGTMVQFTRLTSAQLADFIAGAIVDFGTASGGAQTAKTYITAVETTSGVTTVTLADAVTITTDTFVSIHGRINIQDAEIGSMSGYLGTNGKSDVYYRGEALWGNMFFYTLGAYKSDTEHVWLAEEGTEDNYDAINTSVHTDTGIILSSTSGYIKVLEWPDKLKTLSACALCTEIGGSSSNPVGDYFYITTGSSRVLMVGGRAINGTRCGPFCWHWAGTASDSYWDYAGRPRLKIPLGV